jgi:O-antigen/teichoic acid export membrane protein
VAVLLLAVATTAIITRAVGAEGYGYVTAAVAFLLANAHIADLGLYLVVAQRLAKLTPPAQATLISTALLLRGIAYVLVWLLVGSLLIFLQYPADVWRGYWWAGFGFLGLALAQVLVPLFQARLAVYWLAGGDIMGRLVVLLTAWWMSSLNFRPYFYVIALSCGGAITFLWYWWRGNKLLSLRVKPRLQILKELPRSAWPYALGIVFALIFLKTDTLMLSYLRPPEEVGWYGLAFRIIEASVFFPAMFAGLLLPHLAQGGKRAQNLLGRGFALMSILAIPLGISLWLFSSPLVQLLGGEQFAPSVNILRILGLALALMFWGNLFGNALVASRQGKAFLCLTAGLALSNVLLNLWAIPRYGAWGAAGTTLLTELSSVVVGGYLVWRKWHFSFPLHWLLALLAAGGAMWIGGNVFPQLGWQLLGAALGYLLLIRICAPQYFHEMLNFLRSGLHEQR